MKTRFDGITPGKRDKYVNGGGYNVISDCNGVDVSVAFFGQNTSAGPSGSHSISRKEAAANASLDVVAPQMLALLKRLAEIDHTTWEGKREVKSIIADTRSLLAVEEEKP